jgi:carboxyl-terminal processing protease
MLLGPEVENTPINNFDLLWKEFDRYYPSFIVKNINWDSLKAVYRGGVTPQLTEILLWNIISDMLWNLDDGHVFMYNRDNSMFFDSKRHFGSHEGEFRIDLVKNSYLNGRYNTAGGGRIMYGRMVGDSIGYIYLGDFSGNSSWAEDIDRVVAELTDVKAMIIDIRDNTGGNFYNPEYIASAFINEEITYLMEKSRNGPGHNDFTEPFYHTLSPRPHTVRYTKRIVILTNKITASAAEIFGLVFKMLPYAVQIGDSTSGDLGASNRSFQLPNGWKYHMPQSLDLTADGRSLEGIGLVPDIFIRNSKGEIRNGYDRILSYAIQYLTR